MALLERVHNVAPILFSESKFDTRFTPRFLYILISHLMLPFCHSKRIKTVFQRNTFFTTKRIPSLYITVFVFLRCFLPVVHQILPPSTYFLYATSASSMETNSSPTTNFTQSVARGIQYFVPPGEINIS